MLLWLYIASLALLVGCYLIRLLGLVGLVWDIRTRDKALAHGRVRE